MRRTLFPLILLVVLAVLPLGCNSDDDDDSASPQGGAVAKAFMTGGGVSIGYWDSISGHFPILSGASGTVENSKLTLKLPDGYEQYLPLYVRVYDATLFTDTGNVVLQDNLFGMIRKGDDLDKVYVSIFSTIAAHAYGQAIGGGASAETALKVSNSAVRAVFNSLGLSGVNVNADNILMIDPTSATPAVAADFEKAQQAVRMILGIGADSEGLTGIENAILGFVDDVLVTVQNGGEYTAAEFISSDLVKRRIGITPAEFVVANENALNSAVLATFRAGQERGATSVSGQDAFEKAEAYTANVSTLVSLDTSRSEFMFGEDEGAQQTGTPVTVGFRTAEDNPVDGVYSVVESTGTLLFSTDGTTFATTVTDQNTATSDKLYIRVPGNTTGSFTAVLSNSDLHLRNTVTVTVLPSGTVSVSSLDMASNPPTGCYVEMDGGAEEEVRVEHETFGFIGASGTVTIPALTAQIETLGSGGNTTFTARLKLNDDLEFFDFGHGTTLSATIWTTDGTDWATNSTEFNISTGGLITIPADLKIQADDDIDFGTCPFTFQLLDSEGNLLKTSTVNLYVLTAEGSDNIARLEDLQYEDTTWKNVVDAGGYAAGSTVKTYELTQKFKATPKTWRQLAGVANNSYQAPASAYLFTSPVTERGGFGTGTPSALGHNMALVVPGTTSGDIEFDASTAPGNDNWLYITVSANTEDVQLNYETVDLKVWYGNADGPKVNSVNPVKFQATEN